MKRKNMVIGWVFWILFLTFVLLPGVHGQELADKQVCILGTRDQDVSTLDPHFAKGWSEVPMMNLVHESLLAWHRGNFDLNQLIPALATNWEVSKDKLTWTFYLRKNVKWHEGYGEFTAEDVKFSIERALDPKVGSPLNQPLKPIEKVRVVDPYTVKITTKFPVATLPKIMINYRTGFIMCKKAVEEMGEKIKFHPIGTGPFAFKEYRPREGVTFVPHDGYWRGKPILKRLDVLFVPDDSTRELSLRRGELHGINIPSKQGVVNRLRKDGFDVHLTKPSDMSVLHFNITKKPLDDIKVRRALCYALDRNAFINFFGKDVAEKQYAPIPSWYVGHPNRSQIKTYPYDPKRAKKLLAEAGYPDGFTMEAVISNRNTYLPPMQIVQEMWKKIGVKLNLKTVDHPTYHKLIRQDVNPVVWYNSSRYPFTGHVPLQNFYHSDSIVLKPKANVNFSHYGEVDADGDGKIDSIDALIEEAYIESDPDKQKSLWIEAQQQLTEHAVSFTSYTRKYAMAKVPYLDLGFEQRSGELYDICEDSRMLKH